MYCFRKRHLWGSKLHAGNSIPLRFYLRWSAFWGRCPKIRVWHYYIIWQKGWLLRWGFGMVPAIIYQAIPIFFFVKRQRAGRFWRCWLTKNKQENLNQIRIFVSVYVRYLLSNSVSHISHLDAYIDGVLKGFKGLDQPWAKPADRILRWYKAKKRDNRNFILQRKVNYKRGGMHDMFTVK